MLIVVYIRMKIIRLLEIVVQAGFYWVNTYALDKRPLYALEALTLHEAVPGHHLQISLNAEFKKVAGNLMTS